MRVISLTNASSVPHPDTGEVYDAGPDGVFDLPHELAVHLTTKHASQWRGEGEHEAQATAAQLDELRNPHLVAPKLLDHRRRIEALEQDSVPRADLDAVLARIEALEAAAEQSDTPGDDTGRSDGDGDTSEAADGQETVQSEAKPTRSHKAPAKKAAAKPVE